MRSVLFTAMMVFLAVPACAQVWTGTGDDVIDFSRPFTPALVHITGNAGSHYFGVTSYTSTGGYVDLLVNTTDPYDGIRPLDFENEHAGRFVVEASDSWRIEILPIASAHTVVIPGTITGSGDDVVATAGGAPNTASISGNAGGHYFGIVAYGYTGNYLKLLVNTTDPYTGTVVIPSNAKYLVIEAEDAWSITVNGWPCTYSVGQFTRVFPDDGGSTSIYVSTATWCSWTTLSLADWISFTTGGGNGSGSTVMVVQPNAAPAARNGTVMIAGTNYTVSQAGYSPGPSIISVKSKKSTPGSPATIRGTGFSNQASSNTVKFGKYKATITKATTTQLTVTIPRKCKNGSTYNVVVVSNGAASNAYPFKLK